MPLFDDDELYIKKRDRRQFIKDGIAFIGGVGAAALLPPAYVRAVFDESHQGSSAFKEIGSSARKMLVVLHLGGGNDGLNTIIPYSNGNYYDIRPDISIKDEDILKINDDLAMHKSLTEIKKLYDDGNVALILGAGYPNPNKSHFLSMDIWHSASTNPQDTSGWLGRLIDATTFEVNSQWKAANINNLASPSFQGSMTETPSIQSPKQYNFRFGSKRMGRSADWLKIQTMQKSYSQGNRYINPSLLAMNEARYGDQLAFVSQMGIEAYQSTLNLNQNITDYQSLIKYPSTPLGQAYQTVSQLIDAEIGTGICYITTGGFDTHYNQNIEQAKLLESFSQATNIFYQDMQKRNRDKDVSVLVWSEFGRRVKENDSGGTDHGAAAPMFLIGGNVKGGLYGEQPDIKKLDDNGDLRYTIDFRSVYSSVLSQYLKTDPKDILDKQYPEIDLFV